MRPVMSEAPGPGQESVWDYPRPPRVEASTETVDIRLGGEVIAHTRAALRVLETSHPPAYHLPRHAFVPGVLRPVEGSTFCEWKGVATYADLVDGEVVRAQEGGFYGGRVTASVAGPFKGGPGSHGW